MPTMTGSAKRGPALGAIALGTILAAPRSAAAADPDPWWGPDKALHYGASAAIAGVAYAVSTQFFDTVPARAAFAAGVALAAGVLKETLDAAGLGDPSFRDLTWDVIGTACGVTVAISVDAALRPSTPKRRARATLAVW
jgi:putative lipoprotein